MSEISLHPNSDIFNAEYYDNVVQPGGYIYSSRQQQQQLKMKLAAVNDFGPYESILFIGCARGFEVKYFLQAGRKDAWGRDISAHAIETAETDIKRRLQIYDGIHLADDPDDSFDLVAAFDVLLLSPPAERPLLLAEIVRVANRGIVFRTVVASNIIENECMDGIMVKYEPWEYWVNQICKSGKFKLLKANSQGHEFHFYFQRK